MEQNNFNALFDQWASTYDQTVYDLKGEYGEVFTNYDDILRRVAAAFGFERGATVVDIGVGSGNLSRTLLQLHYNVIGIEPSEAMRKLAGSKIPGLQIYNGSFLSLPEEANNVEGFASTYAFHHLTDAEKAQSLKEMAKRLAPHGKIIFADTAYENEQAKEVIFNDVKSKKQMNLLKDLEREYYTFIDIHRRNFNDAGLTFHCEQLNKFVWLLVGVKSQ